MNLSMKRLHSKAFQKHFFADLLTLPVSMAANSQTCANYSDLYLLLRSEFITRLAGVSVLFINVEL